MSHHEVRLPANIAYQAVGGSSFNTKVTSNPSGYEQRAALRAAELARWVLPLDKLSQADYRELDAFHKIMRGKAHTFKHLDRADHQGTLEFLGIGDESKTDFQIVKQYGDFRLSYPITAIATGIKTFTIAGDLTATILAGDFIEVIGSTAAAIDKWYVVSTSTVNGANTDIVVTGTIASNPDANGSIYVCYQKTIVKIARTDRDGDAVSITVTVAGSTETEGSGADKYSVDDTTGIITFGANIIPAADEEVKATFYFEKKVRFDDDHLPAMVTAAQDTPIYSVEMPVVEVRGI